MAPCAAWLNCQTLPNHPERLNLIAKIIQG